MVIPMITYWPAVVMPAVESHQRRVITIENRAQKIVGTTMKLPNIKTIVKKRCCVQVYRILDNNFCDSFLNYFDLIDTRDNFYFFLYIHKQKFTVKKRYKNEIKYNTWTTTYKQRDITMQTFNNSGPRKALL